jgi:RNA polymerase sigma-70 factor (ECF subfamily)|tara:strand:+ start:292 stop:804 length:513 start_codon:yes stop_codon:yes gene_type:complete
LRQNANIQDLFLTHRAALVDYASGLTGNRANAEDLVQEAWMRLSQATDRRRLDEPRNYLYRIVRNLAIDGHRKTAREQRTLLNQKDDIHGVHDAPSTATPETIALYRDQLSQVQDAMAELPQRTRIALEMHRIGGYKLREIAATLNISLPMAHILVAEGVDHCKRRLGWP